MHRIFFLTRKKRDYIGSKGKISSQRKKLRRYKSILRAENTGAVKPV